MDSLDIDLGPVKEKPKKQRKFNRQLVSYEHYGYHIPFCFNKKRIPFFTIGPDWNYFLGMLTFFFAISMFSLYIIQKHPHNTRFWIGFSINLLQFISYGYTAMRNPGICCKKEMDEEDFLDEQSSRKFCTICQVKLSDSRVHCADCDICIEDYDHHCPWTGKCIGKNNIFMFNIFLLSTVLFFIGNFILIVFSVAETSLSKFD